MNTAIEHLKAIALRDYEDADDTTLWEILTEGDEIESEIVSEHRWYDDERKVVKVEGMFIEYYDYHITGDNTSWDMGLENQFDTICEVEPYEVTVTKYRKKK